MNKKLIVCAISTALLLPTVAFAFEGQPGTTNIDSAIRNILNFVWVIFIAFAVLSFIIAGVMFLSAQGDPEKIKEAKKAVLWGVVGVIVAIIAFSIVGIIRRNFGV